MSIEQCFYLSEICYESNEWLSDILKKEFKVDDFLINDIRNYLLEVDCEINVKQKNDIGLPNIGICEINNKLIISFSGLSSTLNLLSCLNYFLTYNNELECYVHNGFNNILYNLLDEINLIIDVKKKNDIIFTGHSLGAAIAKIVCLHFNKIKGRNYSCVTFACPLVGDQSFGEQYDKFVKKSKTFLCQKDFVVNIPLFRKCIQKNCYMINGNRIIPYKKKTCGYFYNLITFNVDTHRLRYLYKKIIKDSNKLDFSLISKFDN